MAATMDVPESQRLIALSLGKIAASRGQKGGINLHKNLLVATVLTKARAAYMIQHMNASKQRAAAVSVTAVSSSHVSSSSSTCVEMKEAKPEPPSVSTTTTTTTSPATSSSPSSVPAAAASLAFHSSSPAPTPAAPQSVTPLPETASVPESAAGSCSMQVAESEDKENTPPPSPPCRDASSPSPSPSSLDCEKRLQGEPCVDAVKEGNKTALCSRPVGVSHGQQSNTTTTTTTTTRDYVSRPSSTCCLLKRRRAMDRDHENVSAPKVRILEARVSDSSTTTAASTTATTTTTTTPEPMQCDSPQISNLVNIFNTSFSGLSGAASSGGDVSGVRNVVGQSILSTVSSHKLSDNNLTCAKEMTKVGLDSLHHPLVLSV